MAVLEEIYNDRYVVGELMDFPGFRFYPTEEELVGFYLKKQVQGGHLLNLDIVIPTLDLYRYDPWELPGLANDAAERQWFFFVPRQSKNSCPRPNRLTMSGFWKATGTDRAVRNKQLQCIGLKKTLVFYKGKAPGGQRTDWIMNEYRLPDFNSSRIKNKIDIVLCRIYRKAASRKSMEERTKPNHVEESAGDEYEEKLSHSFAVNGRGQLSNPVRKTELCSLHYQNQERVCSFDLCKTNVEENLAECLEPITEASCRAPDLELSTFMVELFTHEPTTSSWEDTGNAWSPHALLSTP